MKKFLLSLSILLLGSGLSFAQSNQAGDLREKSMLFFVNSLDWISKKSDNIIPEFRSHRNKRIIYRYTNEDVDLMKELYGTQKSNPDWKGREDGYFSVAKKFSSRYEPVMIMDSAQAVANDPYDINVTVSNVMEDAEFSYVFLTFKSIGNLSIFYEGEVVCKFDKKGNLVKYSYIER